MSEPIQPLTPGSHHRRLFHQDRERSYLVHVPLAYTGAEPWPLVIAYHGGATDAAAMVRFCGLNETAEKERFLVAYPNGTGRREHLLTWNAGTCCGYAMWNRVDDVGFTAAMIDQIAREVNLDTKRVYAAGMPNGAMIAYRLASELSERITAIAAIAGPMAQDSCRPSRPVPIIHFHGTEDESAPFAGGIGSRSIARVYKHSVEYTLIQWIAANGCPARPQVKDLPTIHDELRVTRFTYGPGQNGAEIVLYRIEGGGHTWPGLPPKISFLGPCTQNISANELLWDFFSRYSL
jgi:polyhydroxybutyrate depolymerase